MPGSSHAAYTTRPADSSDALLTVRDLRVSFPVRRGLLGRIAGSVRAVDGVTFDVPRGRTLGLVGESGCGKSTLGRAILRLVDSQAGSVIFGGVDVLSASRTELRGLRRDMRIVFQDTFGSLNPRMTVGSSIAEPLVIHAALTRPQRDAAVADLLTKVGLRPSDAARYPHELSGGQRQRIGIARALALKPKLVICDEPVSALDVSVQSQVLNLLRDLQTEFALTYLFIAHDLAVVRCVSDRVAVMYLGRIVEIADVDDLYARPAHPYTHTLLEAVPNIDPTSARRRHTPIGDVPSPIDPPGGCAFHPRCRHATDLCRDEAPDLMLNEELDGGHRVACHFPVLHASAAAVREP